MYNENERQKFDGIHIECDPIKCINTYLIPRSTQYTKHAVPIDRRPINNDKIQRGFYLLVAHTNKTGKNHNEKVSNWKRGLIKLIKSIMRQKYIKSHSEFTMVYFLAHSGRYKENGHDSDWISLPPSFIALCLNIVIAIFIFTITIVTAIASLCEMLRLKMRNLNRISKEFHK